MAAPPAPSPPLSRRKRLAFTAAMLLLPLVFFALVEGTLRLAGYGADHPLFLPTPETDAYLVQNREVARRYFAQQANVPNSPSDYFLAEKPTDGLRVFVQGGSSAAGYPFYYGGAFPRMLEQRLQQTFPDRTVEVVNTSMSAVNSYTLLDLADEILAHEPDAVLIYAGHNEYYGALGAASAESLGRSPWLVRTYLALQHLRLVQAMRGGLVALARARAGDGGGPPSNTLMARMVGEQRVPLGSEVYEDGLRQFRSNLARLLATYEAAGVPVFIGTVASNERDHRPFLNAFEADTDQDVWEATVTAGVRALRRGDPDAAIRTLTEATETDTLAADGFYWLGRALLADGQTNAARTALLRARELDALRFRAPAPINVIIREEAAAHGATVVDSEGRLRAAAPDGLIGEAAMMEHLHPTLDGYFLIADAFYESLREAQAFGSDWAGAVPTAIARTERLYTPVDSLAGVFRVAQLMSGWPFRPGEAPALDVLDTLRARTVPEQIAVDLYQDQTSWRGATDALATHYAEQGLLTEALRTRFALIQELPHLPGPLVDAGNLLVEAAEATGDASRYQQAEAFYEAALERAPDNAGIVGLLGALKLQRGARAEAIALLERARDLDAENTQVLYNLSGAYALEGRTADARRTAEAILQLDPSHTGARALLASLPS